MANKIIHDLDFDEIFESDDSIRFVGICNMQGNLLDAKYRPGLTPLFSDRALQFSVLKTAIRSTTRASEDKSLGEPVYSVTCYRNVKRATIPIKDDLLLLVSFEKNQNESEIVNKILDILKNI